MNTYKNSYIWIHTRNAPQYLSSRYLQSLGMAWLMQIMLLECWNAYISHYFFSLISKQTDLVTVPQTLSHHPRFKFLFFTEIPFSHISSLTVWIMFNYQAYLGCYLYHRYLEDFYPLWSLDLETKPHFIYPSLMKLIFL